jgi:hypothetical protein
MSTAEGNSVGTSPKTKRTILLVAVVVVGALGVAVTSQVSRWKHRGTPVREGGRGAGGGRPRIAAVPASSAELSLLAPLVEGSSIGGAEVVRISGVEEGLIHVDLRKSGEVLHLAIGLAHDGYNAPRAGRYSVYIWERVPSAAASSLAEVLAASLRPHASRPAPPGLTSGNFNSPPH